MPVLGLNKEKLPDRTKLKEYFFDDEFEALQHIPPTVLALTSQNPILLYPGCGTDVLTPLLFVERLFPELMQITLLFMDISNNLNLIKTILHEVNISFAQRGNTVQFYWQALLVTLEFREENIFSHIHTIGSYDIYFEKCFRIMKDQAVGYEREVYDRLSEEGILISDSGFEGLPLERYDFPQELSMYGEMIVGKKK